MAQSNDNQDWNVVTFNKKSAQNPKSGTLYSQEINIKSKKRKRQDNTSTIAKSEEARPITTISVSISSLIRDARKVKGMTQKELANKINEKPDIISKYESGKAFPDQQILGKMEKVLGVKLRGKIS
jgi:putative transcription factor